MTGRGIWPAEILIAMLRQQQSFGNTKGHNAAEILAKTDTLHTHTYSQRIHSHAGSFYADVLEREFYINIYILD